MSEENDKRDNEDQPKSESKSQPTGQGSASAASPAMNEDDVQAYGEPSDGSGGTRESQMDSPSQPTKPASSPTSAKSAEDEDDVQAYGEPSDGSGGTNSGT